ncbi:hypothetical protein LV779_13895 [Streptomyces thinghirensis]|nr:hypothetical protein [Streptomyces thinghirensis]
MARLPRDVEDDGRRPWLTFRDAIRVTAPTASVLTCCPRSTSGDSDEKRDFGEGLLHRAHRLARRPDLQGPHPPMSWIAPPRR